jgi:hypothetical protein
LIGLQDEEYCRQLLLLLYLLGTSSKGLQHVSNKEITARIISLLGTNTSLRCQRLVLRLCRKILPLQKQDDVKNIAELLFNQLGMLLAERIYCRQIQMVGTSPPIDIISKQSTETNPNQFIKNHNTLSWMNGFTLDSLIAEYIHLIRYLMRSPGEEMTWRNTICSLLRDSLSLITELTKQLATNPNALNKEEFITKKYHRILASICVLGGFQEFVRVGSRVNVGTSSNLVQRSATVVDTTRQIESKVMIVYDFDMSQRPYEVDVKQLQLFPETQLEANVVDAMKPSLLPLLLDLGLFFISSYH